MHECLFKDDETPEDPIRVEGITRTFGFHRGRVREHTAEITALLAELSDEFQVQRGGGWTFLNACTDRHGRLWTGEQTVAEELFVLGIAAGKARWLMPREMWEAFPGGVPYVAVTPDPVEKLAG